MRMTRMTRCCAVAMGVAALALVSKAARAEDSDAGGRSAFPAETTAVPGGVLAADAGANEAPQEFTESERDMLEQLSQEDPALAEQSGGYMTNDDLLTILLIVLIVVIIL